MKIELYTNNVIIVRVHERSSNDDGYIGIAEGVDAFAKTEPMPTPELAASAAIIELGSKLQKSATFKAFGNCHLKQR